MLNIELAAHGWRPAKGLFLLSSQVTLAMAWVNSLLSWASQQTKTFSLSSQQNETFVWSSQRKT